MFKRRFGNHRGMAIIEFALVLPLLLAFIGGAIDFGVAFFVSHTVQNAAREGARFGVTQPGLVNNDARVITRVQDRFPVGSLFDSFRAGISQTLTACGQNGLGGEVVVTVEGESQYFFLRIIPTLDTLSIARGVTMRYELCPS